MLRPTARFKLHRSRREDYGNNAFDERLRMLIMALPALLQLVETATLHQRIAEDDPPRSHRSNASPNTFINDVKECHSLSAKLRPLLDILGSLQPAEDMKTIPLQFLLAPDNIGAPVQRALKPPWLRCRLRR